MKKALSLVLVLVMVLSLAACGGNSGGSSVQETTAPADPFAPYEETVTLTSFFEIAAPIQATFKQEQLDEYEMVQAIQNMSNVKIDYLWYAVDSADDAETKKNTAIATGDIPDFMICSSAQLALLAKSDLINKDLQPLFDTYANDTLKAWTTAEGPDALNSAKYGGKLIAIPLVDSSIDGAPFMWIRTDWLKNLGLEAPKTMDELYNVMKAFKEQDPDGNGVDDTVGMALHKNFLSTGTGDCAGLFDGFAAYPLSWVEDGNGGLQYGATTENSKKALEFLAKCYAEGLLPEDFSTMDDGGTVELIASGQAGIQFGAQWNAMWPLTMTSANDPNADWTAYAIPGLSDGGAPGISLRIVGYVVINAECEHPEAVIKLLNGWCDAFANSTPEEYNSYLEETDTVPQIPQHHIMLKTWNPLKNLNAHLHIKDVVNGADVSTLNAEELGYYNDVVAYMDGDLAGAPGYKTFGPEGSSFSVMNEYYSQGLFHMNKFTGAQTPTMAKKMSTVQDKVYEFFTKVIMGIESLDNFEAFLAELGNLGLTEITAEVNEWYASK